MPSTAAESVHVVAGVLRDARGRVLVAGRLPGKWRDDQWEFPGGKVREGEEPPQALARELDEELGIRLRDMRPLIRYRHAYPHLDVLLDVWDVQRYEGEPQPREGQRLRWEHPGDLDDIDFLDGNRAIVRAVQLPPLYLITDSARYGTDKTLQGLEDALECGVRLVQMREKHLAAPRFLELAAELVERCRRAGARLLVNADPQLVERIGADGVHLDSQRLMSLNARPLRTPGLLVAASCHDEHELARAQSIGADFVTLSTVLRTGSHPDARPLGWQRFGELAGAAALPVYALGGLSPADAGLARWQGAQGVAAISSVWGADSIAAAVKPSMASAVSGEAG